MEHVTAKELMRPCFMSLSVLLLGRDENEVVWALPSVKTTGAGQNLNGAHPKALDCEGKQEEAGEIDPWTGPG
jgi:hypothetical protein